MSWKSSASSRNTRFGRSTRPSFTTHFTRTPSPGPVSPSSGCQTAIRRFYSKPPFLIKPSSPIFFCFSLRPFNSDWTVQRLLIGTHTSNDEQNYVQIIKVKIPLESSKDTREYKEGLDEPGQTSGPAALSKGAAATSGQATGAQGGVDLAKNERI